MTKAEAEKMTADAGRIHLGANATPPIFREDVSASKVRPVAETVVSS